MTIIAVLGSYLRHRPGVEAYLQWRSQQAHAVRQQNEQRTDPLGVRERLFARQSATRP